MSSRVFISYRRTDAAGHAGRLYDRLRHWFDAGELFYDAASIDSGAVFPQVLRDAVDQADAVLVLIGPDWASELNRRSTLPAVDYVRAEVAQALARLGQRKAPLLLPVVLAGTGMPTRADLDAALLADLGPLLHLNAHSFVGNQVDWDHQFKTLCDRLATHLGAPLRYRPPPERRVPWRVVGQAPTPFFQDADGQLGALRASLAGSSGPAAVNGTALVASRALVGMGGVGKTQLALHYSLQYRDAYPGGVWWFRAEQAVTLQQDALDACAAAGVELHDGELPSDTLREWLAQQSTAWLLVYDNAEDPAALRPHLPAAGPHHVLVTSRHPGWAGLVAGTMPLPTWTDTQGAHFLAARLAGYPGTQPEALLSQLSHTLGGLPLALEQAAAFLSHTAMPLADYLFAAQHVDTAALVLDEGRAATGYERSVLQTLQLAFPRLSTPAQRLLRLLAWFAAEPVAERWFKDGASLLDESLQTGVAQPLVWSRWVGELRQYGLVERIALATLHTDRSDGPPTAALQMHRLTQEVVRHALGDAQADQSVVLSLLDNAMPIDTERPEHWPAAALLVPHVRWQQDRLPSSRQARSAFSRLANSAAIYLQLGSASYADAVGLFQAAFDINVADLGESHPATHATMLNMAGALGNKGDFEAARLLQVRALDSSRLDLGDEDPSTLDCMSNLAITLFQQGELTQAHELQRLVLDTRQRRFGKRHRSTFTAMSNLAVTLSRLGDLTGAHKLQSEELDLTRAAFGEAAPETLTSSNNLALTLRELGKSQEAVAMLRNVVRLSRQTYGAGHPRVAQAMINLAVALAHAGEFDEALPLHTQGVELLNTLLGSTHPSARKAQASLNALQQEALAVLLRPSTRSMSNA